MRRFRPARRDEGAAAVEFALLFPIFMILALGLINGGLAFSRQINVTQAAREASRFGSTYDVGGISGGAGLLATREDTWLDAVDTAVQESAGNSANPIAGFDYRCVAIVRMNSAGTAADTTFSRYKETYTGSASTRGSGACPSTTPAAIASGTYAQVVLSRDVKFFVLFISPTLHLDAVSITPYEGNLS